MKPCRILCWNISRVKTQRSRKIRRLSRASTTPPNRHATVCVVTRNTSVREECCSTVTESEFFDLFFISTILLLLCAPIRTARFGIRIAIFTPEKSIFQTGCRGNDFSEGRHCGTNSGTNVSVRYAFQYTYGTGKLEKLSSGRKRAPGYRGPDTRSGKSIFPGVRILN